MAFLQIVATALVVFIGLSAIQKAQCLPVLNSSESGSSISDSGDGSEASDELGSGREFIIHRNSSKDLYVVKAVVYEIGILTDSSDEDNSTDFESHERVDLTFFDAHKNSSHIDLGRVPLPIQTNISGQVLTGIAPVDIGAFSNPAQLLQTLPITGTIVNITHSDTGYFQLSTSNLTGYEKPHILSISDLKHLSDIPDLTTQLTGQQLEKTKKSTDNLIKK